MKYLFFLLIFLNSKFCLSEELIFRGFLLDEKKISNVQNSLLEYGYKEQFSGNLELTISLLEEWMLNNRFKNINFNNCIYEKLVSNSFKYCDNDLIKSEIILKTEIINTKNNLLDAKDACKDLGIRTETEKFADCVLQLSK